MGGSALIDIATLKDASQLRIYKAGTIFCKDGTGNDMYILVQGKVAVISNHDRNMSTVLGPGDYFNEFLVFSEEQVRISTIALTDVTALPISKFSMPTFASDEPRLAFELMQAMFARFAALNGEYQRATGHRWFPKPTEAPNPVPAPAAGSAAPASEEVDAAPKPAPTKQQIPAPARGAISHEECALFPEGHTGKYELKLSKIDNTRLCEIDYTCPACGAKFKALKILTSRLGASKADPDTRKHYKNFDPIYYEVVTCPVCLFSAFGNQFNSIEIVQTDFLEQIQVYQSAGFRFGSEPDTAAIFAGYYLALLCAPQSFLKPQLIQASLLHKLSWMYHDCGDEVLEKQFMQKALDQYVRGYVETTMSAEKEVQLCMIIGELSFEAGNLKDAKNYYYKAKMNAMAPAFLKRRAENRLEDLKEYEQKLQGGEQEPAADTSTSEGKGRLFRRGSKN